MNSEWGRTKIKLGFAALNLIYTERLEGTHMSSKKTRTESDRLDHIIAEARHDRERREKT